MPGTSPQMLAPCRQMNPWVSTGTLCKMCMGQYGADLLAVANVQQFPCLSRRPRDSIGRRCGATRMRRGCPGARLAPSDFPRSSGANPFQILAQTPSPRYHRSCHIAVGQPGDQRPSLPGQGGAGVLWNGADVCTIATKSRAPCAMSTGAGGRKGRQGCAVHAKLPATGHCPLCHFADQCGGGAG